MIRRGLCLLLITACALALCIPARADGKKYLTGEVLVRVQPGIDLARLTTDLAATVIDQLKGTHVYRLRIPPGADPEAVIKLLRLNLWVVWAEPNRIVICPETDGNQWTSTFDAGSAEEPYEDQEAVGQSGYTMSSQRASGSGETVAILDTGIADSHPELRSSVVNGWNTLDDGPKTEDVPDFRDNNGNGAVDEAVGHGTMVAGLVHRFAPRARLMPVRVLDSDGSGHLWALAEGILYAVDRGARVLNLSLGLAERSFLLEEVVDDAYRRGAVIVTSAGNGNTERPQYPAGLPRVLTVAALNPNNTRAWFSNYGGMVDVCAPGVRVCSTNWNGRFAVGSGTSFAAPIVAAEVALIRSVAPGLTGDTVQAIVRETATRVDDANPSYRGRLGSGLLHIDRAIRRILGP
jgi:subtilisin family serine protease